MKNQRTYESKDFYSAALLKTLGLPLLRLNRGSGRFVTFVFEDQNNDADDILRRYWNREITVVARDLIDSIHELKTRLHTQA